MIENSPLSRLLTLLQDGRNDFSHFLKIQKEWKDDNIQNSNLIIEYIENIALVNDYKSDPDTIEDMINKESINYSFDTFRFNLYDLKLIANNPADMSLALANIYLEKYGFTTYSFDIFDDNIGFIIIKIENLSEIQRLVGYCYGLSTPGGMFYQWHYPLGEIRTNTPSMSFVEYYKDTERKGHKFDTKIYKEWLLDKYEHGFIWSAWYIGSHYFYGEFGFEYNYNLGSVYMNYFFTQSHPLPVENNCNNPMIIFLCDAARLLQNREFLINFFENDLYSYDSRIQACCFYYLGLYLTDVPHDIEIKKIHSKSYKKMIDIVDKIFPDHDLKELIGEQKPIK